jgi:hypothetical protein
MRFCRKAFVLIEVCLPQACLCRELRELLEGGETVWRDPPLSDHVRCFDACDGGCGGMEGLEPEHRPGDPLDEAVILLEYVLEYVVEVLTCKSLITRPALVNLRMTFTACKPARLAPRLSITTRSGWLLAAIARLKKRRASAVLRRSDSMKSRV